MTPLGSGFGSDHDPQWFARLAGLAERYKERVCDGIL